MKKTPATKSRKVQEMASEYRFDYKKAKLNRFVAHMKDEPLIVMIELDFEKVYVMRDWGVRINDYLTHRITIREVTS